MRCSWLHRLLGRIAPQKPGNAAVVRRRLRLGRGSSRLARLCRRLRIHVVAGRRRLGDSSGSGAGAASLGLFFEPGGRPRFFAEGDSSAAASPSMTLAFWASVNMRMSAARVSWRSI